MTVAGHLADVAVTTAIIMNVITETTFILETKLNLQEHNS